MRRFVDRPGELRRCCQRGQTTHQPLLNKQITATIHDGRDHEVIGAQIHEVPPIVRPFK